jgi:hypothetical protein
MRRINVPARDTVQAVRPANQPAPDTMSAHYQSLLRKMEEAFDTLQKQQAKNVSAQPLSRTPASIPVIPGAPAVPDNKPTQPQPTVTEVKPAGMSASQLQLQASGTNLLTGSMMLRLNNTAAEPEVVVVIRQPDGKVIQKNSWESGLIQTSEGRSIYSCKLRLDAAPGESKKIQVSLETGGLQPGMYTLSVYHEGVLIGKKSNKVLGS